MEQLQNQSPTFDSVWALLQENAKAQKESRTDFDRIMKEAEQERKKSRADFDRRMKEAEQERKASRADFDRRMKEAEQQRKASGADFDRRMKEAEQQRKASNADYDRRMKKMEETMGSWSNNHGFFAEEYFFNSFENGKQNFFGEKFDEIEKNIKGFKKDFKDEYDILLINGKSIGIIEVKFKAYENDVPKVLRKAETFRVNFPEYKNHRIYLGLATMVFYPELEQECIKQGIAVVKQVGDTVVINDANLKVF